MRDILYEVRLLQNNAHILSTISSSPPPQWGHDSMFRTSRPFFCWKTDSAHKRGACRASFTTDHIHPYSSQHHMLAVFLNGIIFLLKKILQKETYKISVNIRLNIPKGIQKYMHNVQADMLKSLPCS